MRNTAECEHITDDLADLVANDPAAIEKHADHIADCDTCRDRRHEASRLAALVARAGDDHVGGEDLVAKVLAAADAEVKAGGTGAAPQPAVDAMAATAAMEAAAASTLTGIGAASANTSSAAQDASASASAAAAKDRASTSASSASASSAAGAAAKSSDKSREVTPITSAPKKRSPYLALGAIAALAAGGVAVVKLVPGDPDRPSDRAATNEHLADAGGIGTVSTIERGAKDNLSGLEIETGGAWVAIAKDAKIPANAKLRTDERTRVALAMTGGTRLVLDHTTTVAFDKTGLRLVAGRVVADLGARMAIATPISQIDGDAAKLAITTTDAVTSVQVVRGTVMLVAGTAKQDVRAGEEGIVERGAIAVSPAPALTHDVAWAELASTLGASATEPDEVTSGLGALRAYKPGESRDRDWKLALAKHDVKVRIVGPIARTEITETFRNDSDTQLEGVYQFPLPADAQIDGLALDIKDAPGGFLEGAFLDKERGAKIWKGVIDKAAPKKLEIASNEMIWVPGKWRDPALLDWKRGGRFELKIFPIPAKGSRTIKIAYTQVVTPRGPWRQYTYPLPHSTDGSTVADNFTVDVEVRGAANGMVRAAGYQLAADPKRTDVNALTLTAGGFVPRGDLVVDYRAAEGDAELRAWTYAGGQAVAPDEKLAKTKNVGIDPKVVEAQRAVAADLRPTAVVALHPKLPRWTEDKRRDYAIVLDGSQSMTGERFTRASELARSLVDQMDRRDRFTLMVCDVECRRIGDAMRSPSPAANADVTKFLANEIPAGASDLVGTVRSAAKELDGGTHEKWILYVGDGFSTTGFRKTGDIEKAIADTTSTSNIHVSTIGLGTDADANVLAAAARGGGGSYLAWLPGQKTTQTASVALESTFGAALRDVTVTLPSGLADVAPTKIGTIRAGNEVLIAARVTGDIAGDVVLTGTLAGQRFEQRYALKTQVSSAAGNAFVPRLWASLAIEQAERAGSGVDRHKIVALSQGYGVMSRETSLLVLESQAMFDAFGVDRGQPTQKWTGEDSLDEVVGGGMLDTTADSAPDGAAAPMATGASAGKAADTADARVATKATTTPRTPAPKAEPKPAEDKAEKKKDLDDEMPAKKPSINTGAIGQGRRGDEILVRRTWLRIPSVAAYGGVNPAITKAVAAAETTLAANPDSREKHRALVQALSYAGDLAKARDVAARWLERDKLDPQALGYLADLLGRDGQRELALRTLAGLVDLAPDRPELHERMIRAYESVGRSTHACGHRIALASMGKATTASSAAALRCLRGLGRANDADLVARALPDDAARAAAEKLATVIPVPATASGDLVVSGTWTAGADLDITIVAPDGSRISWMGGRTDAVVTDASSTEREKLAIKSIKKGNFLVEIGRAKSASFGIAPRGSVRGTLDITLLGQKRSIPFDLTGDRATVARFGITLQEQMVDQFGTPVYRNYGEPGWDRGRPTGPTRPLPMRRGR